MQIFIRTNLNKATKSCLLASLVVATAACDRNKTPDVTTVASNIRYTGEDGNVIWYTLFEEENLNFIGEEGIGYSIKSGVNEHGTAITFAGLVNEDQIDPPTGTGTATYSGRSNAVSVRYPGGLESLLIPGVRNGDFQRSSHSAPVSITANLDDGTFTGENGTGGNRGFKHSFEGAFKNGAIKGTGRINYGTPRDIDTRLEGRIGDDRAVLVFNGVSVSTAVSGGMDLSRD